MSEKDNKSNKKNSTALGDNARMIVISKPVTGKTSLPDQLPVLALRNSALFPGAVIPVAVNRAKSRALVDSINGPHSILVAASQRNPEVEEPDLDDLYKFGVAANIVKSMTLPDGTQTIILQGIERVELTEIVSSEPFLTASIKRARESRISAAQKEQLPAMISSLRDAAFGMFKLMENAPAEAGLAIRNIDDNGFLVNFIASNLDISVAEKNAILECNNLFQRAEKVLTAVASVNQFLKIKDDIQTKARRDIDKQQREYILQQQMRTIQDELGNDPQKAIVEKYREKAACKKWSKEVAEAFDREVERFSQMNTNSPEYAIAQNYLDTMVSLPWGEYSHDNQDLDNAERILNNEHYGLDKVKERIIEHLAVLKLKGDMKSPILCLYGPPGVGKTSLGKSIAEALGRKYVRISLGGMHDEAEIRGHRRTYIGAMPGRIIEGLRNAGTSNPVFVLDEIDKISSDFRGDPASALLEVLDPEQNAAFHDNFLDVDYDLSKVMFIATANSTSTISAPLLDRMETIAVDGYLLEEKLEIAKRHLLPKEKANHGLTDDSFDIADDVLAYVIDKYTRESGVRQLDKVIAHICRKVALEVAKSGKAAQGALSKEKVQEFLGVEKFDHDIWHDDLGAGVVTGLAWTAVGGEILFVECATSKGKGQMTLTGNLGNVMKESAILALGYIRSNAAALGVENVKFDETDFNIHVPEGAVPKDGPSAGITMVTAIVSALTGRRVKKRLAMTGEITLRGMVIPVGGITEKILAAKRAGITDIILCSQNRKDIGEIKDKYIEGLTFHYVDRIAEVIDLALEK
ncbi:MAG: endopeptidase La [Marinilabiliaceae bacterium]